MDRSVLARKPMTELKDIATHLDMRGFQKLRKAELIDAIVESATGQAGGAQAAPASDSGEDAAAGARKVLPPTARDSAPADPVQVDGQADGESEDPEGESAQASPTSAADDAPDDGGRSRSRTRPSSGPAPRQRGRDGESARAGEQAPAAGAPAAGEGGEPDGEDDPSRKRGRRKRNRDRNDDAATTSGQDTSSQGSQDQGRGDQGRGDQGRSDQSRTDHGRGDQGRADQGRGDQGRGDQGRADQGRGEQGRADQGRAAKGKPEQRGRSEQQDAGRGNAGRQHESEDVEGDLEDADRGAGRKDSDAGEVRAGVLDILPEGYGFLRTTGYLPGSRDVYVSQGQIRKHALRRGDVVQGPIRQQRSNEKVPALHHVQRVNGAELVAGRVEDRVDFRRLTAIHADEPLVFSGPDSPAVLKAMDLMAPIGRGHRGLIMAPYAGGRTELLKALAQGLDDHSPEIHLMVVLVDERPEDVTDVERSVPGEVISSTFDHPADEHAQVAELALERARRLVELGHDVVILLDSLTRLARAHGSGTETTAIHAAKRFFGAARNVEEGGSLTILATLQVDTGSEIDDAVARELQTTANVVLTLDGEVPRSQRPAVQPAGSQTLREERLLDDDTLAALRARRSNVLDGAEGVDATLALLKAFS